MTDRSQHCCLCGALRRPTQKPVESFGNGTRCLPDHIEPQLLDRAALALLREYLSSPDKQEMFEGWTAECLRRAASEHPGKAPAKIWQMARDEAAAVITVCRDHDAAAADLRAHWMDFCDNDQFPDSEDFPEFMKAAGLIDLVPVKPEDLDHPFAAELGSGMKWILIAAGRAAIAKAEGRP